MNDDYLTSSIKLDAKTNLLSLGEKAGIPKRYLHVGDILTQKPETIRYEYTDWKEGSKLMTIDRKIQLQWVDEYRTGKFKDGFRCLVSSFRVDELAKRSAFQLAFHTIAKKKLFNGVTKVLNAAKLQDYKPNKTKMIGCYFIYNVQDSMTPFRLQNIRDFLEETSVPVFVIHGGENPISFYRNTLGVTFDSVLFFGDAVKSKQV